MTYILDARELAWAGGLFEGEGSFHLTKTFKPRAALCMSDEDSVRRFHRAVGVGRVNGPRLPRGGTKEVWTWQAAKFEEFQAAVVFIWYGLGARRRAKAIEILAGVQYVDKSRCGHGHMRNVENTIHRPNGKTECRLCALKTRRDSYRRQHGVPEGKYRK
jgi:hypothetical protein